MQGFSFTTKSALFLLLSNVLFLQWFLFTFTKQGRHPQGSAGHIQDLLLLLEMSRERGSQELTVITPPKRGRNLVQGGAKEKLMERSYFSRLF